MGFRSRSTIASGVALAGLAASLAAAQGAGDNAAQVAAGRAVYETNCAVCHGKELVAGQFAPALKGPGFVVKWAGASSADLASYIHSSMPPGNAGNLSETELNALVALIFSENGGDSRLANAVIPTPTGPARVDLGVGGLSTRVHPLPPGPAIPDRFAGFTPIAEAELANPAPEDWPAWRRSHLGLGYSPLKQIDTTNVGRLTIAWAQALPPGGNMTEPLARGGVVYAGGFGDQVFAFDGASGRMLWRYTRKLPATTPVTAHKTIALWGDKIVTATSDNHLVALDARSGRPVWDVAVTNRTGMRQPGGPLVADGVVMMGMASQEPGGGIIAAFDAETGKHLWTFDTVAKPGQLGGDTWNGVPPELRKGGSVWTSGSYDPVNKLALWGVGNTYDTGPYRDLKPGLNNDTLFMESTLAFEPRSGKLVWYYQHNKNDQYDLDWVFDRTVGALEIDGKQRRVVVTGGKSGLFDTLDAKTGKYLKTYDMGIQDYIDRIDPVTGDKHVKPEKIPGRDKGPVYMCPHGGGGRNWSPTSLNPETRAFFVNARDVCTDLVPPATGPGFLTTGVNAVYAPPPNGDGNYGVLQGINLENNKLLWEVRRRQTPDMGILTTAGGLLFTGWMDRQFVAYDQASGKQLWTTGVSGVPNASAITYAVDGKQYVAMVTGAGNPLSSGIPDVIPETQAPPVNSSTLYVFALPDN
jgi:alcohol dehydrogenase (cytochrome c)